MFGGMRERVPVGGNAIDVARESVLSFGEAARFVGKLKGSRPIALQTLWRWATKGCSGVVLETVCVGGCRCTSKDALQRFFAAVTQSRARTPASDSRHGEALSALPGRGEVERILTDAGITGAEGDA